MSCKQRCVHYNDGIPSREVEEDWESTGHEEMNQLYQDIKDREIQKTPKANVLDVRDRLNNLKDLIEVCSESLIYSKINNINTRVAHVLYFQVNKEIQKAEEELASI